MTSPPPTTSSPAAGSATTTPANAGALTIVAEYPGDVWLDFTPDGTAIVLHGGELALVDQAGGEFVVLVEEVAATPEGPPAEARGPTCEPSSHDAMARQSAGPR